MSRNKSNEIRTQQMYFNFDSSVQISKIMVRENGRLTINDTVFTMIGSNGQRQSFLSPMSGRVTKLCIHESDILTPGSIILEYEECRHTVVFRNLCSDCGINVNHLPLSSIETGIRIEPSFPDVIISRDEGVTYDNEERDYLLRKRKLHLLVDLDQTLIHTSECKTNSLQTPDIISYQLTPISPTFHTKLRPGVKTFLTNLYPFYQFYLVTFGDRLYAETIAKILDPNRTFFSHRILSRDECLNLTDKTANLNTLFPSGDSLVCIIDDREDVWKSAPNLVQVKPYVWFQDVGDINDTFLPARSDNDRCENDPSADVDQYLFHLEPILKHIHTEFYQAYDQWTIDKQGPMPDLKQIIPNIRQEILQSVSLSFSHLMPQDFPIEKHRATIIAKAMGATVTQDLQYDSNGKLQTTHIIAGKRTLKVYQAQQNHIHVVTPEWLLDSYEYWHRQPEENYVFTRNYQIRKSRLFTDRSPRITIKRSRHAQTQSEVSPHKQEMVELNNKVDDLFIEGSDDDDDDDLDHRPKKQQKTTFLAEAIEQQFDQHDYDSDSSNECRLHNLSLNENDADNSDEQGLSDDETPRGWKNQSRQSKQ